MRVWIWPTRTLPPRPLPLPLPLPALVLTPDSLPGSSLAENCLGKPLPGELPREPLAQGDPPPRVWPLSGDDSVREAFISCEPGEDWALDRWKKADRVAAGGLPL